MRFVRVRDKRLGIEYEWMADIQSFEDFLEIEKSFTSRNASCIVDYISSKDYAFVVNETFEGNPISKEGKDHCRSNNKLSTFLHGCVLTFPENTKFYPLFYFVEKLDSAVKSKINDLEKYGRILININGGYFTWNKNIEEIESMEDDRFPQYSIKDVKVSKWLGGSHYYVTVNGNLISIDGMEKWKTAKSADEAAKRWIKRGKSGKK